jgi:hypothetical protein
MLSQPLVPRSGSYKGLSSPIAYCRTVERDREKESLLYTPYYYDVQCYTTLAY